MDIPEGYVLVPREVYDMLVQQAKPAPPMPMPLADPPGGYPGSVYPIYPYPIATFGKGQSEEWTAKPSF
jgi:hypothetical protein